MTDEEDSPGPRDLVSTVDDAIEILTAFLSAAAGAEVPHDKLVTAAHQVVHDLGAWRVKLGAIVDRGDGGKEVQ
jgi:hypothetical protein